MKNNSSLIRENIIKYYGFIANLYNYQSANEINSTFWNSLDAFESDSPIKIFTVPSTYDNKYLYNIPETAKFLAITSKIQMYTDFYRFNKYSNIIYNKELKDLNDSCSYEGLNQNFNDKKLSNVMFFSLVRYAESSGYKKVLLNKCLNKNDVEKLSKVNPFFKEEYDKCNISLDLDFIKKHISKWQTSFPDDEAESYIQSADFIMKLYKINPEEARELLIDLFRQIQDLGILSYNGEDDETIKIGQVSVNNENLALMLRDFYQYEVKTLKK